MEQDVTRNIEEQLSAFLDGELPDDELQLLVRRLERDEEHRETLARYAAIGSLLRNEPAQISGDSLRERLITALDDLSEEGSAAAAIQPKVEQPARAQSYYGRNALIAASVAVLAIVGVYAIEAGGPLAPASVSSQRPELATLSQPASGSDVVAGAINQGAARASSPIRSSQRAAIDPDRMTSYLVSHGEYSRSFQGGMVDSRIFVQQASFER